MKEIFTIKKTFSIRQIIRSMWAVFLREWKVLVIGALVYVLISFLIGGEHQSDSLSFIAGLINIVLLYLYFGVIRVLLRMIRGESYSAQYLKTDFKTILYILGGALLYIIPFALGVFLLFAIVGPSILAVGGPLGLGVGAIILSIIVIIAAFVYSVRFNLYYFFVIDRGLKPLPALKASMKATKGSTLRLIGFTILSIIAIVVGAMFAGLGLLIVLPLFLLCQCAIYEKLSKHMYGESSEFPIVQPAELTEATPTEILVVESKEE